MVPAGITAPIEAALPIAERYCTVYPPWLMTTVVLGVIWAQPTRGKASRAAALRRRVRVKKHSYQQRVEEKRGYWFGYVSPKATPGKGARRHGRVPFAALPWPLGWPSVLLPAARRQMRIAERNAHAAAGIIIHGRAASNREAYHQVFNETVNFSGTTPPWPGCLPRRGLA